MSVAVRFNTAVFSANTAFAVMMQGNMAEFEAAVRQPERFIAQKNVRPDSRSEENT